MPYLILIIVLIGATTLMLSQVFKDKEQFKMFLVYSLITYVVIIGLIVSVRILIEGT
jgi:hypothetical protein